MVASRIRCIVVEVPALAETIEHRLSQPARELLPWADPYIASLIRKLQEEVRQERTAQHEAARQEIFARQFASRCTLRGEAPPPAIGEPIEFELPGDEDWPLLQDIPTEDAGR